MLAGLSINPKSAFAYTTICDNTYDVSTSGDGSVVSTFDTDLKKLSITSATETVVPSLVDICTDL